MLKKPKRYKEDPTHTMPRQFLSDEVYAQAIATLVFCTTDAVIVDRMKKTIWLAKRRAKPMQGWWWIGGRILAGEPEEVAIVRNFKRETGLDLPAERFQFVLLQRYQWKDRAQEPQKIGSDCLSYVHVVDLSRNELAQVSRQLDEKEYLDVGLTEFTREQLVEEDVHEAIIDLYDEIFWDDQI